MWRKRMACMVLAGALLFGTLWTSVSAAETDVSLSNDMITLFATGNLNVTIPAKSQMLANSSFSLAAGETVTIQAYYSPSYASVDFGLVAPDGKYYYVNTTTGNIDKTIQVNANGKYTLQIINNADVDVQVAGFVNY